MLAFGRTLIYVVEIEIEIEIGPSPTSIPSGILIPAAIWQQQIWAKMGGSAPPLGEGELGRGLPACQVSS